MNRQLMTTLEVSNYTGLSRRTFEKFRLCGGGPVFIKAGRRRVLYDRLDVDQWLDAGKRKSTSDTGQDAA